MINLKIEGIEKLGKNVQRKLRDIEKKFSRGIVLAAQMMEREAKLAVPVRFGFLQSSIYHRSTGRYSAEFGARMNYAYYVEFGTSKMRAQPYLRPAIMAARIQMPNLFRRIKIIG